MWLPNSQKHLEWSLFKVQLESFLQFLLQFFIIYSLYYGVRNPSFQQLTSAFISIASVVLSLSKSLIPQKLWNLNETSTLVKLKKTLWVVCFCSSFMTYNILAPLILVGYFMHIHSLMPPSTQNYMYISIGVKVFYEVLKWSLVTNCIDKSKKLQLNFLMTSFNYFLDSVTFSVDYYILILPYYPLMGIGIVVMVALFSCLTLFLCLVFGFAGFNVSRKREILDLDLIASRRFCPARLVTAS